MKVAIYDIQSGRIDRVVFGPKTQIQQQALDGESFLDITGNDAADDASWYVDLSGDEPGLRQRAAMNPSVSTSTGQAEITNMPDPCEIHWKGQYAEATGGAATLTFDEPGTYTLTLRAEPAYLPHTLEVDIP